MTSLEDLEKSLQAQGFAPLTPGTLASIAQVNATTQPQEQPSLSSALAQLGNITQPTAGVTSDEPWWNTMFSQAPEQRATTSSPRSVGEHSMPYTGANAQPVQEVVAPLPTLPATPVPPVTAPLPSTVPLQSSRSQPSTASTPLTPAYRSDALLDSDLETTMKRPAIKLQPMLAGSGERVSAASKSYSHERFSSDHGDNSTLNYRERLVRGYQYQLAGAYDEAMNDYRLITKHAPELLDDVISNMRALLKLNPRFSQGYRVLGDAYMRKGEYLQAMEAYNQALTMAKKAKN